MYLSPCTTTLGRLKIDYSLWSPGDILTADTLAVDTETTVVEDDSHEIPQLVLMTASSGQEHRIIERHHVADFLVAHRNCDLIGHNFVFDFHVLRQHFEQTGRYDAREALFRAGDEMRLHDTMWLDALYQLAAFDLPPVPRDLGTVAKTHAKLPVDKNDPYRKRYGEILGKPLQTVDRGFLDYAIRDAVATYETMAQLYQKAVRLAHRHDVPQQMIDRFGPLTEALQTVASIVFAEITRNGIGIDLDHLAALRSELQQKIDELVDSMEAMPEAAGLFRRDKQGQYKMTGSGRPGMDQKGVLQPLLTQIADQQEIDAPITSRGITTARKFWDEFRADHPFLEAYCQLDETCKLNTFLVKIDSDRIHPTYNPMVKTGRSSSSKPNFQQIPKDERFRALFIAAPDHQLVTIDFKAIELRTLAAECLHRYGESRLAEVFRAGGDPHALLAADFLGQDLETFLERPDAKELRGRVKPVSFGCPGGMQAEGLADYARRSYGQELTVNEAAAFRTTMITVTYPEIGRWLESDQPSVMAQGLNTTREEVIRAFGDGPILGAARRVVGGRPYKRSGHYYDETFVDEIWRRLAAVNRNADLDAMIAQRDTQTLPQRIFWQPVKTMTGRVRARAAYTQSRNLPFQALAADGCKLGLWRLYRRGFKVVGFVHDEIVAEIPDDGRTQEKAKQIDRILCQAMEELTPGVPCTCEYSVGKQWAKP